VGVGSNTAILYHCGGQPPRGVCGLTTLFLLLQDLFSPSLDDSRVFHFLPPVRSFSDVIRECTHPQLDNLPVERCRKLTPALKESTLTVLGCSLPCHCIWWYSESRKGWSNPPSGSWTARARLGSLRLLDIFFMVVVVWVIGPCPITAGWFLNGGCAIAITATSRTGDHQQYR